MAPVVCQRLRERHASTEASAQDAQACGLSRVPGGDAVNDLWENSRGPRAWVNDRAWLGRKLAHVRHSGLVCMAGSLGYMGSPHEYWLPLCVRSNHSEMPLPSSAVVDEPVTCMGCLAVMP